MISGSSTASKTLSDQCKEIEEKNKIGKTRDLVKKIRDTKGTFHAKMGSIKDRNGMDLIEAEDLEREVQEEAGIKCKQWARPSHLPPPRS